MTFAKRFYENLACLAGHRLLYGVAIYQHLLHLVFVDDMPKLVDAPILQ
jgi:hypothetical protein